MRKLTLEQVDDARAQIKNLVRTLVAAPTFENAALLRAKCHRFHGQMHGDGGLGDVATKLSKVATAAVLFEKSRVDLTQAKADLHRAVAEMDVTIDTHRHAPR